MAERETPDIAIFPPTLSVLAPVAAVVMEWVAPLGLMPPRWTAWSVAVGVVILAVAGWLAIAGEGAFKRAKTNVDPRKPALVLVEEGPFRFTRNPMYLGMVLLQAGLAFTFSLDWALMLTPVVWAVLHFGVVLREETYLVGRFGAPYEQYLTQTRRWV